MMHVGSPKLLVISDSDQTEASDEEEVQFRPHVTPHERLKQALSSLLTSLLALLCLLGDCIQRVRGRRRGRGLDNDNSSRGAEEEGQSEGSLNHAPLRAEPEMMSEVLQMEMEAGTPLPGEIVTTPPVGGDTAVARATPTEGKEEAETTFRQPSSPPSTPSWNQ